MNRIPNLIRNYPLIIPPAFGTAGAFYGGFSAINAGYEDIDCINSRGEKVGKTPSKISFGEIVFLGIFGSAVGAVAGVALSFTWPFVIPAYVYHKINKR